MPFSDTIKKAAELAKKAADTATAKAAEMADQHGDKVAAGAGTLAEKAGKAVDKRTGGKYTPHIEKAKGAVVTGVTKGAEKLAEKNPAATRTVPGTTTDTAVGAEGAAKDAAHHTSAAAKATAAEAEHGVEADLDATTPKVDRNF